MKEFFYKEHSIRVVAIGKASWFVVKDICRVFEFATFRDWVKTQKANHFRLVGVPDRRGRVQKTWVTDRAGLMTLAGKIGHPDGKTFGRWLIRQAETVPNAGGPAETEKESSSALQVIDERSLLGKDFRVYGSADDPLFLAQDVAAWIDYAKTGNGAYDVSRMLQTVDEEEKLVRTMFVSGQKREVLFLTEDGLYEVLMLSRKPIAKDFKKRVKEILRSIRRTGSYGAPRMVAGYPVPEDLESMLRVMTNLAAELRKQEDVILRLSEALEDQATIMDMAARSCRGYTRILLEKGGVRLGGGVGDGLVGENA